MREIERRIIMSRQFDEYVSDRFEVLGEEYTLVSPTSFEELMDALRIRDIIQNGINGMMHDEDDSGLQNMLSTQDANIQEYMDSLGDFDNSLLISNINYLTKKSGMRIGDLEKLLGISAGYISRTAKEGSGKKMSIDIVWKIARLFGVELRVLLDTNLVIPNKNSELIARFLTRLRQQTEDNKIQWNNCGGAMCNIEERFKTLGLFEEEADGSMVYTCDHMNPDVKWTLKDDLYACDDIVPGREFVMIGFGHPETDDSYYLDFNFVYPETIDHKTIYRWEKVCYASDDKFREITPYAENLMDRVQCQELDAQIPASARSMIADYLKSV